MSKLITRLKVSLIALLGIGPVLELLAAQAQPGSSVPQPGDVAADPLGSDIAIPWPQIQAALARAQQQNQPLTLFERTAPLSSPDGGSAVYSRLLIQARPQLLESKVSSVLFWQDLRTGEIQAVAASQPRESREAATAELTGLAVLVPVAWSGSGLQVLCRDFQGGFATDFISDYALVWDRQQRQTFLLAPHSVRYSNAILLGWSRQHPDRALFKAGLIGEANWPQWTVQLDGQTAAAPEDQPLR